MTRNDQVTTRSSDPPPGAETEYPPEGSRPRPDGLTAREAEVLALIATGRTNAQIAKVLFVSRSTVKTHINNIFAKTGLADRAQAVHYARQHQLAGRGPASPGGAGQCPMRKPAGNGSSGSSR